MPDESPALLRLLASRCRSIVASSADPETQDLLEMARELDERADDLETQPIKPDNDA